ncbi:choice-of-anchor H family protein [Shewanella sp. A14]
MKQHSNKMLNIAPSRKQFQLGLSLCVACALGLSSSAAFSAEESTSQVSGAFSQARQLDTSAIISDTETQQRVAELHQQAMVLSGRAATTQKVTREQMMALHQKEAATKESQQQRVLAQQNQVVYYDFSFYGADSFLLEDNDYDGFYQTFSVIFDADINSSAGDIQSDVFAELYLSQDGGPWIHYYSTDVFSLYSNSSDDDYEVMTTLASGYQTDHYDVLIDLYELGYGDPVATVSSDNANHLYALPLESSDRDTVYVEEVYIETEHSGGALSWLSFGLLGSFAWFRRFYMNKK